MARQVRSNRIEIPPEKIEELKERLIRNTQPNLNGCWEWTLLRNPQGYGNTTCGTIRSSAHRISYAAFNGPVPAGLVVCHHCDNPPCINPAHLYIGTQEENAHDCMEKGRANFPQELEFCKKGLHKMEGYNVLNAKKERRGNYWRGGRQCRACKMAVNKRYLERKKAAVAA